MKEHLNSLAGFTATGGLWVVSQTLRDDARFFSDVFTGLAGAATVAGIVWHWWRKRKEKAKHFKHPHK